MSFHNLLSFEFTLCARIDFCQDYLFKIIVMKKKPLKFFFCVKSMKKKENNWCGAWNLVATGCQFVLVKTPVTYLIPNGHVFVFRSKCSKVQATRLICIQIQSSFRFRVNITKLMLNACPLICVL